MGTERDDYMELPEELEPDEENEERVCGLCGCELAAVREADTPEAGCSGCNPGYGR
jgi:hypothetical protein